MIRKPPPTPSSPVRKPDHEPADEGAGQAATPVDAAAVDGARGAGVRLVRQHPHPGAEHQGGEERQYDVVWK
jgi:hypothetical protein